MFFETKDVSRQSLNALGLKYNPFKAIVAPRPIGWVTTQDRNGVVKAQVGTAIPLFIVNLLIIYFLAF